MSWRSDTLHLPNWIMICGAICTSLASLFLFSALKLQIALIAAGGFAFLAAAIFRPSLSLALLCAMLPVEGISVRSMGVTEVRLAGIGVLVIWIAHLLLHGKRIRFDRTFLFGVMLVAWAGLSLVWANRIDDAGAYYFTLIQCLVLFLLCINVIESESDFRIVMAGFLLGALASTPFALSVFVQNVIERARVFEAQNPNSYSMVIGFSILAGLYLVRKLRGFWIRSVLMAGTLFLVVPLTLAQSRSGWLATAFAIGVMIWYTRHRLRNYLLTLGVAAALVAGLFAAGMISFSVVDRAYGLVSMRDQGSSRLDVWRVAGNMFADNPVLGVGFNQFPNTFNQYRPETPSIRRDQIASRDPHNTYVGVATELGLIGLGLLLLLFWSACREEKIPRDRLPWISDTMVAYVMMFSVGGTMLLGKLFWVALALAAKARTLAAEAIEKAEVAG